MPLFAETQSDVVQIVQLVTACVIALQGGWIVYQLQKQKIAAEKAGVKVEEVRKTAAVAAEAVEDVKTTLKETKSATDEKLEELADIAAATHVLVNSAMGAQLKLNAETSRFKADTTKNPIDIAAAELAEHTLADHVAKQRAVDLRAENGGYEHHH